MGHHMLSNMRRIQDSLRALTLERDGVDGRQIYLYGEGWNFGEVANGARGVNATQHNVAGTGIGTFSDRMRDAVRGGGPFNPVQEQGFATGLFHEPNGVTPGSPAEQRARLLYYADLVRLGLAGNLADFVFEDREGHTIRGAELIYGGQPAGYTRDPQEVINYVEAHDSETFFDALQLKAPGAMPMDVRVRLHNMAVSTVMLSQGVPFFHAGQDLLRSKSLDRNSYDSGDWFNKLDFTLGSNNWGVGLPPAWDNQGNWPVLRPLLSDPALRPRREHIEAAAAHFREMLRIRKSSPLFRLGTAEEVLSKVSFLNTGPDQVPGLVVIGARGHAARRRPSPRGDRGRLQRHAGGADLHRRGAEAAAVPPPSRPGLLTRSGGPSLLLRFPAGPLHGARLDDGGVRGQRPSRALSSEGLQRTRAVTGVGNGRSSFRLSKSGSSKT